MAGELTSTDSVELKNVTRTKIVGVSEREISFVAWEWPSLLEQLLQLN
jgi:hypothetical protein